MPDSIRFVSCERTPLAAFQSITLVGTNWAWGSDFPAYELLL